jgi:hypothetical protein
MLIPLSGRAELRQHGWGANEFARRRKGGREKVKIARRVRIEAAMTCSWIAQHLSMGAPGSAANCIRNKNR